MNTNRIELALCTFGLGVATAVVMTLAAAGPQAGISARLQPTGGEPAFSARELAGREAMLHAAPTRREAERMRIETIARAQGRSDREASAIADAVLVARPQGNGLASR